MPAFEKRLLGATGLTVGPLGVAASYGAPAHAFEEAFDKGCNYFYLGSGRHRSGMKRAIRNLCGRGQREKLVVAIQSYARYGVLTEKFFRSSLRSMGLERADIFILGWHNRRPSERLVDRALAMKENGLFRFLGMSGHNRGLFPQMAGDGKFDLFHIRYNAAHRGAEEETFPYLTDGTRPGIVSYTATRWGHLLNPKKMPPEESVPASSDCYRFALTNPAVDVCLCGPRTISQMRQALEALEPGPLAVEDLARMKRIGDFIRNTHKRF
jgi:predicted aldo/keto reductase-like oxidoreductase